MALNDVDVNILYGQVETIAGHPFGTLIVSVPSSPDLVGKIIGQLKSSGNAVEHLGYVVVGLVVNATRSTPFIILVVAIVPLTRLIAGTSIGTAAATVPLTIAATPFIARVIEAAIREVDQGLIEAARAFGASPLQIVRKVLLPEAMPGVTLALTLTAVSLIGYSAMVGAVGGGGLGDLGIRYGYQRFMPEVMLTVVLVLIALVQSVQTIGDTIARRLDKRSRRS